MKSRITALLLLLFVVEATVIRAQEYDERYDINKVGKVTVADVTALVNYILGKSPEVKSCPDNHHPHAIDLGLPSGTKWCCCNVGASTPEGYGGYYAWGETSEKSMYVGSTYAYYDRVEYKYIDIGSDIAGTGYDVATVRMGVPWCMPSTAQQQELLSNCSRQWTQQNGVSGTLVTGPNGGQIFLPAAGFRWYGDLSSVGSNGYYWSSSLDPSYDGGAYGMGFYSSGWRWDGSYYRDNGLSVRAVRP